MSIDKILDYRYIVSGLNPQRENMFALLFPTSLFKTYCVENDLQEEVKKMRFFSFVCWFLRVTSLVYFVYEYAITKEHLLSPDPKAYVIPSAIFLFSLVFKFISENYFLKIKEHIISYNVEKYRALFL